MENKINENGAVFEATLEEIVKEVIEKGTSKSIENVFNFINSVYQTSFKLESIAEGKDILFRIIDDTVKNSVKIITPFVNILSISVILSGLSLGLKNDNIIKATALLLKGEGMEINNKNAVTTMLTHCATAYISMDKMLKHDNTQFKEIAEGL